MAMTFVHVIRKYPARCSALAVLAILLTATTSKAGFEWVPAPKAAPSNSLPAPAESDAFLPAPDPAPAPLAEEPQVLVAPAHAERAPVPAQDAMMPQNTGLTAADQNAAPDAPVALAPVEAMETPAPAPAPIEAKTIKTKSFVTPENLLEAAPPQPQPNNVEAPHPEMVRTRIVVPENAPEAAKESLPGLQISPMPLGENPPPAPAFAPAPAATANAAPSDPVTGYGEYEAAQGFGSDIPLAIALTQIVPAGYSYSFGTHVNPGLKVSWTGGKSWPDVIQTMIDPLDLRMEIRGKMVFIGTKSLSALQPAAPNAAALEPAAGTGAEGAASAMKEAAPRRMVIDDPGEERAQQPQQTLSMIEETQNETVPEAANQAPEPLVDAQPDHIAAQEDTAPNLPGIAMIEEDESFALAAADSDMMAAESAEAETVIFSEPLQVQTADAEPVATGAPETRAASALWRAQKGDSLKRTLDIWSRQANYDLQWESSHDYTIESDVLVTGDIQRAVQTVFSDAVKTDEMPMLTFIAGRAQGERGTIVISGDQHG